MRSDTLALMLRTLLTPALLLAALPVLAGPAETGIFKSYMGVQGALVKAREAFAGRDFLAARSHLKACTDRIPDHFEAHFLLAQMAYAGKDYPAALNHIETAKRSLAMLEALHKRQKEEVRLAKQAWKQEAQASLQDIDSRTGGVYGCGGNEVMDLRATLSRVDSEERAVAQYEGLLPPPASYHFVHGNCLFRLDRRSEALAQYLAATRADPRHADAWNNLINLQLLEKDTKAATLSLKQAEDAKIVVNPRLRQAVLAPAGN